LAGETKKIRAAKKWKQAKPKKKGKKKKKKKEIVIGVELSQRLSLLRSLYTLNCPTTNPSISFYKSNKTGENWKKLFRSDFWGRRGTGNGKKSGG
jgi:hypothetical protein